MGKYLHVKREIYAQPNVVVIGKKRNLFALSFVALHLPEFWGYFKENINSTELQIN